MQLVERHVRATRPGDLVQALIARPLDDGVVARTEKRVDQAEDGLLGTGEGQHLVRLDAFVQPGDLAAQQRMAGRLRVTEGQAVPEPMRLVIGQGQQLGHWHALDIRGAQEALDRELPTSEIALQLEVGDTHPLMMRHDARHA